MHIVEFYISSYLPTKGIVIFVHVPNTGVKQCQEETSTQIEEIMLSPVGQGTHNITQLSYEEKNEHETKAQPAGHPIPNGPHLSSVRIPPSFYVKQKLVSGKEHAKSFTVTIPKIYQDIG